MFIMSKRTGVVVGLLIFSLTTFLHAEPITAVNVSTRTIANSINGQVWDPNNRPVPNMYVELLNEVNSTLDRQKTSESGVFTFRGVSAGRFTIHVLAFGTDFLEAKQDVQIINLVQGMSDNQYVEIRLRYDPKKLNLGSGGAAEDIFVQEGIPKEAERHYTKGIGLLENKKSAEAIAEFKLALSLFPSYYVALTALGKELVEQKKYSESLEPLIRAVDINQRSFTGYYALGYACYQLNEIPQAVEAARASTILKADSVNAQLLYGTVLRLFGNYEIAEKTLLKAKSIDNKVAQVNWQLALVYNRLKRNQEAADELETYLKNQPNADNRKDVQDLIVKLRTSRAVKFQ
jgi:tetratricopeptide (TPR) repeat protein